MIDNDNGRKWARFWLIVALLVSTVANVTHACLAKSDITLWLRVPGAVIWPVFTFAGIEILVRMVWQKRLPHTATQWVLMSAAVPAAITSYEHQFTLLGLMGERLVIQCIGPVAIDGLMIGCTMALLFTRKLPAPPERVQAVVTLEEELERLTLADLTSPAPVSPAPVVNDAPKSERAPVTRASNGEMESKVREMLDTPSLDTGGSSTLRRYASVARTLRDDPQAEITARGVRPDIINTIIRPWAMQERVR